MQVFRAVLCSCLAALHRFAAVRAKQVRAVVSALDRPRVVLRAPAALCRLRLVLLRVALAVVCRFLVAHQQVVAVATCLCPLAAARAARVVVYLCLRGRRRRWAALCRSKLVQARRMAARFPFRLARTAVLCA